MDQREIPEPSVPAHRPANGRLDARSTVWEDTGLHWIPTSPNIPTIGAARGYTATGFLGEIGIESGIGSPGAVSSCVGNGLEHQCSGGPVLTRCTFLVSARRALPVPNLQRTLGNFKRTTAFTWLSTRATRET